MFHRIEEILHFDEFHRSYPRMQALHEIRDDLLQRWKRDKWPLLLRCQLQRWVKFITTIKSLLISLLQRVNNYSNDRNNDTIVKCMNRKDLLKIPAVRTLRFVSVSIFYRENFCDALPLYKTFYIAQYDAFNVAINIENGTITLISHQFRFFFQLRCSYFRLVLRRFTCI